MECVPNNPLIGIDMALIIGQLEALSNSELQKFIKDNKAKGKQPDHQHFKNLRNVHEQARGRHYGRSGK